MTSSTGVPWTLLAGMLAACLTFVDVLEIHTETRLSIQKHKRDFFRNNRKTKIKRTKGDNDKVGKESEIHTVILMQYFTKVWGVCGEECRVLCICVCVGWGGGLPRC